MSELKVAICIEPDFRQCSTPPNPLDSLLKIEGYRRQLEDRLQIKQLGQGFFTASLEDKDSVFDAIGTLDTYASMSGLRVQPFLIQPLDTELQLWLGLKYASPWEQDHSSSIARVEMSKEVDVLGLNPSNKRNPYKAGLDLADPL